MGNPDKKMGGEDEQVVKQQTPEQQEKAKKTNLTPEQQEKLQEFEALKKELDIIKASEKIVGTQRDILAKGLETKGDPKDKEYAEIYAKIQRLTREFDSIVSKKGELNTRIDEIQNDIQRKMDKINNKPKQTKEEKEKKEISDYISKKAKDLGIDEKTLLTALEDKKTEDEDTTVEDRKKIIDSYLADEKFVSVLKLANKEKNSTEQVKQQISGLVKTNPSRWQEKIKQLAPEKEPSKFVKMINDILKSFLGVDILGEYYDVKTNHEQLMQGMVGGDRQSELGSLSEHFESGTKGPFAINFDDNGKSSFGSYQLRGDALEKFAEKNGIEGFKDGVLDDKHEFTKNWKDKIKELGVEKFRDLEHEYIKESHYEPQMTKIKSATGIDANKFTLTTKNVIWSTAVQHGANTSLIVDVLNDLGKIKPGDINDERKLIEAVYKKRTENYGTMSKRYASEQKMALLQLDVFRYDGERFVSAPLERSSRGTTLCSKTARLNLARLGVENIARGSSAKASYEMVKNDSRDVETLMDDDKINVIDLYLDASKKNKEYGHRVVAVREKGEWKVFDPYYNIGNGINGVNANTYINHMKSIKGRKFWGGVGYTV